MMDDQLTDLAERIEVETMGEDEAAIRHVLRDPVSFLPFAHLLALEARADESKGTVDTEQYREMLEDLDRRLRTVPASLSPDERDDYTRTLAAATADRGPRGRDHQAAERIVVYLWGER